MAVPPTLGVILAGGLSRRMGGGDKVLLRLGGRTLLEHVVERLAPQCEGGLVLSANGDPSRFAGFPGPVVPDCVPDHPGPLAGILAALDFAAEQTVRPIEAPHPEVPRSGLEGGLQSSRRLLEGSFEARLRLAPQDEGEDGSKVGIHGTPNSVVSHVVSVSGDAPFLPRDLVVQLHARRQIAKAPMALAVSGGRRHYTCALWPVRLREDLRAALVDRDERRVGAYIARRRAAEESWPTEPLDPFLNVNTPDDLAVAEAALATFRAR